MTTLTTNSYGYNGTLTAEVLETLGKYWPVTSGGSAKKNPWNLDRDTFDNLIVGALEGAPVEPLAGNDPLFEKFDYTEEEKAEHQQFMAQQRASLIAAQKLMTKAGYMSDGKVDSDALWADLTIAGFVIGNVLTGDKLEYFENARNE